MTEIADLPVLNAEMVPDAPRPPEKPKDAKIILHPWAFFWLAFGLFIVGLQLGASAQRRSDERQRVKFECPVPVDKTHRCGADAQIIGLERSREGTVVLYLFCAKGHLFGAHNGQVRIK